MHQMRVAAVAKFIVDNLQAPVDADNIVQAALFHDTGNIIKSDLALFPEFTKPEGLAYWEKVKREYIEKYGSDEHLATIAIARDIGLGARALQLIENVGFGKMLLIRDSDDLEGKVVEYADMRVAPHGVVGIAERVREGAVRYAGTKSGFSSSKYIELTEALKAVEKEVFARSKIKPEDVTGDSVRSVIEELKNYELG